MYLFSWLAMCPTTMFNIMNTCKHFHSMVEEENNEKLREAAEEQCVSILRNMTDKIDIGMDNSVICLRTIEDDKGLKYSLGRAIHQIMHDNKSYNNIHLYSMFSSIISFCACFDRALGKHIEQIVSKMNLKLHKSRNINVIGVQCILDLNECIALFSSPSSQTQMNVTIEYSLHSSMSEHSQGVSLYHGDCKAIAHCSHHCIAMRRVVPRFGLSKYLKYLEQ
jgi:hypothetical protein